MHVGSHLQFMQEDKELSWHRSQIAKNREIVEEAGNTEGSEVFP
jgi:alkylated DNA nucleotide flippase Atl1